MLKKVEEYPDDFRMQHALGRCYAGLGMKDEAMACAEKGYDLMPLSRDALMGIDALRGQMTIYAMLGEKEKALDILARMFSVPCHLRGVFLTHDPVLAPLKDHPRFKDLLERQGVKG